MRRAEKHTPYHTTTYYFEEKSFTLTSFQKSCIFSSKNHFSLFYHFSHEKRSVAIWTLFIIEHRCAAESSCFKSGHDDDHDDANPVFTRNLKKGEKKCLNEFKSFNSTVILSNFLKHMLCTYMSVCVCICNLICKVHHHNF